MLYKVTFEDGEPISAQEFHPTSSNYDTSEYCVITDNERIYLWRIVEAVSILKAMEKAKD